MRMRHFLFKGFSLGDLTCIHNKCSSLAKPNHCVTTTNHSLINAEGFGAA
jgi:hypothetical protein